MDTCETENEKDIYCAGIGPDDIWNDWNDLSMNALRRFSSSSCNTIDILFACKYLEVASATHPDGDRKC
jgi:hypothetical protein